MKNHILITVFIFLLIFSVCSCSENNDFDNQQLLLTSIKTDYSETFCKYDRKNRIIETERYNNDSLYLTTEYFYLENGFLDYTKHTYSDGYYQIVDIKHSNNDSIYFIYGLNKTGTYYAKSMYTIDDNNRVIKVYTSIGDTLLGPGYCTYSYSETNKYIMTIFEDENKIERKIQYTLNNNINPLSLISRDPFKYDAYNIISCEIIFEKEDIEDWNIFTPGEYTSTFEYNSQGYPTKETRWYKDATESEITEFYYN